MHLLAAEKRESTDTCAAAAFLHTNYQLCHVLLIYKVYRILMSYKRQELCALHLADAVAVHYASKSTYDRLFEARCNIK
jgi:hypothetical protein